MSRASWTVLALAASVGAIFALGPSPVARELPEPEALAAPDAPGLLVVDLVDGASEADLQEIEALLGADLDWTHPLSIDEALAEGRVADIDDAVALLSGHPLVEVVEPAMEMVAFGFPNDPMYEKQWHLREMGAPAGWASTPRGKGVVVAVIDTGVTKVDDLDGTTVLTGASFVPGTKSAADDHGHGTHVAGTIAQTTNNGKGVAGVAPEATILPVKVLSAWGGGTSSWIAAGIDYAADNGANVINMSLGGSYSLVIHNAVRKARAKGVVVVAAAGNSGRPGVSYPGALKETIGVGAVGPGGEIAPYSSYGKGVDISAPGGDKRKPGGGVWQNTVDGKGKELYGEFQGTSMATPHVAGAAAILMSTGTCDADCVERVLLQTATPVSGAKAWDPKYGHGRLNLGSALSRVQEVHGSTRFGLGMLFALLVAGLAKGTSRFRGTAGFVSAITAGGLFFLPMLPIGHGPLVQMLSRGFLEWPAVVVGPDWVDFPLWLSAGVPAAVALVLGAVRPTRAVALGFVTGVATHLFHGAATGTLQPWWMPEFLGATWLAGNGVVCLLLALALAGAEKLEGRSA